MIGLHKTGCTFIQEEVLKKIPNSFYTDDWYTIWGKPSQSIIPSIPDKGLVFLANPNLSSTPFASKLYPFELREKYARDLCVRFSNASILVGFRNHEGWVRSLWSQRLRGGIDIGKEFIEFDDFKKELSSDWFKDDEYVALLKSLFKNVFVYRYEWLREDPYMFVNTISNFIGVGPVGWVNRVWKRGYSDDEISEMRRKEAIRRDRNTVHRAQAQRIKPRKVR